MTNLLPTFFPSFFPTPTLTITVTITKVQHDWGKKSPRSQQQSINALLQLVALLNHSDLCKFLPQARYTHCDLCVCLCVCVCVCVYVGVGALLFSCICSALFKTTVPKPKLLLQKSSPIFCMIRSAHHDVISNLITIYLFLT